MWLDAFLSAALAIVSLVASPIIASVGVPHSAHFAVGIAVIALAILLAACGAITVVLIALRLRGGDDLLPARLRLPIPSGMRPPLR